ncbi:GlxA family transcriptional regulator [Janthinobacterium sp. Mn2066]|uniref:GlxA family transcriptional regulator n=1 Tax=Janthinobacterium sp. Mn2066 TaxID=3395264 RepID=UPI003BE58DAF
MHRIAVLALDDVVPLDFGIAYQVFALARQIDGSKAYDVEVCGPKRRIRAASFDMQVRHGLDRLVQADTIVIPGSEDPFSAVPRAVSLALQRAYDRGTRLASICTGVFTLAASGLLNGRRAATHWRVAEDLARLYPQIKVEPNVLFVDEGSIVTSAGASAGLDMCLHLVRRDYGQSVAANTARLTVAPMRRDGGQAQFIRQELPSSPTSLTSLIEWLRDHLSTVHTVDSLAIHANMSPRTFARRFQEQTGTTPLQWLLNARIDRARELLEESEVSIDQTAFLSGFGSAVTFRSRFRRVVGLTPTEYRRRFSATN